jgi:hypothetical protein
MNTILLRCPQCKKEMTVARCTMDYPEAVRVQVACDECCRGDFSEIAYYDADGEHITRDPDELTTDSGGVGNG